jgi:hypothetical protein
MNQSSEKQQKGGYYGSAMERETISKNRVSTKNDKSRINNTIKYPFFLIFALSIMLIETSCKNNATQDDANNSVNSTEEVNRTSSNLEEDYNAWFQLQGKYVENFSLKIAEVNTHSEYWKDDLLIAVVENVTDKERGGFFVAKDVYFPIDALDEEIATLENIATQMKNDVRKYNCIRRYITSYGITITFQYSSSESKWVEIQIYYSSDKGAVTIKPEYLEDYIQGLKNCKQCIVEYKTDKWSNQ